MYTETRLLNGVYNGLARIMAMLASKAADLEHTNEALHRGRVGSGYCTTGVLIIDHS